ncbi:hypothetical protein [Aureispira anguillae]|uniref:Uncharacterized protein n=1 Tax=Aureispira anguillae TaxID=2864201 RepID=A0A915YHL5_9BACT|nr:hypothetical protein [Aureispira anguillae]BDS13083.1 hypothetical protein AsAng_0038110 [Aureispira anguillae]
MNDKKRIEESIEVEILALFLEMSDAELIKKKRLFTNYQANRIKRGASIELVNMRLFCLSEAMRIKRFTQKLREVRAAMCFLSFSN